MARPESELTKKWQNSTQPLVSGVCITYNHERFIRVAIECFVAQETDFAFSIVIAEDCSSDNTLAIVDEYCRLYPRVIKLIKNEKNLGVIENFFRTIDSVTTKYAAVCEGDDYWTNPHKLQTQIDSAVISPPETFYVVISFPPPALPSEPMHFTSMTGCWPVEAAISLWNLFSHCQVLAVSCLNQWLFTDSTMMELPKKADYRRLKCSRKACFCFARLIN